MVPVDKTCAGCGRTIAWRKAWADSWDEVRWCSVACRRHGVSDVDIRLSGEIMRLLNDRSSGATICPSEAARSIGADGWRDLMEPARAAARRLVADGTVDITQGGLVVDPSTAKGPIRIRLRPRHHEPERITRRGPRHNKETNL